MKRIASVSTHRKLRALSYALLLSHAALKIFIPRPTLALDLFLFNAISALSALTIFYSPRFNDRWGRRTLGAAILLWTFGSFISTWNSFFAFHLYPTLIDISYSLFYPLCLFGLVRVLGDRAPDGTGRGVSLLETAIFTVGSTSVLAALLYHFASKYLEGSAFSIYLSILYPVGDLLLLVIALTMAVVSKSGMRTLLITLGAAIFSIVDIYFLILSALGRYTFTSLSDDGWLLGIILIAESLWHSPKSHRRSAAATAIAAESALFVAALLLLLSALHPNDFPSFLLLPAFLTVGLAFIKLSLALRQSRQLDEDRELARIDELTGLANRRRFLSELEIFRRKEGTLLLLDLNGFKVVNDRYGHHVGDRVLRIVAERFTKALPHRTVLARLGGDEFGVIVYGPPELGIECAAALRATLTYPVRDGEVVVNLGVAIGEVPNDREENSIEELMRRADSAMYREKRSGLANYLPTEPISRPSRP
jgi:diguanylate cyclase (GGDEF)-like protein